MSVVVRRRSSTEIITADCLTTDNLRDVVRITSVIGGKYQVAKLDITDPAYEAAMGVIIEKQSSMECLVQISGRVSGVYSGMIPGVRVFVGDDSKMTHNVPTRPLVGVKLMYCAGVALAESEILLGFLAPVRIRT